jgi:hypothetical protein
MAVATKKLKQMIFNTKLVNEATDNINDGVQIKRYENPWLKSEVGLRRSGVIFKLSAAEQAEYVKCALDIHHFTETYCQVKTDDGSVGSIKLRDYQKDMLDSFVDNRFNIIMASRQVGKCFSFNTILSIEKDGIQYDIRIGKLYYSMLSSVRELTILEKIKVKLYDWLFIVETPYHSDKEPCKI